MSDAPPDPREVGTDGDGIEPVGSRLRDATVDPRPGDFLAPLNAGQANPHGPEVVAPMIHAAETGPVHPGPVAVDDPAAQDAAESALAEAVFVENQPVGEATAAAAGGGPIEPVEEPEPKPVKKAAAKKKARKKG